MDALAFGPRSLKEICGPIITGKSKEIRPRLVHACGQLLGKVTPQHTIFGQALEALHSASLLHDDVLDHGQERRGKPCIHHKVGAHKAILGGDFLFAQSFSWLISLRSEKIFDLMDTVLKSLIGGQIEESAGIDNMQAYLDICENKTASLFRAACQGAAILSDGCKETQKQLSDFGRLFGIHFQMLDDLSDYETPWQEWGPGHDFVEKKKTLPWFLAFKKDAKGVDALEISQDLAGGYEAAQAFFAPYVLEGRQLACDFAQQAWDNVRPFYDAQALDLFKAALDA